jgi:drug/metabolite transporter superfamily protein YnfA
MDILNSVWVQQVVRAVRLFVITFLATFQLTSVTGGRAAFIAGVLAAAEVAWRTVFPVKASASRKTNL